MTSGGFVSHPAVKGNSSTILKAGRGGISGAQKKWYQLPIYEGENLCLGFRARAWVQLFVWQGRPLILDHRGNQNDSRRSGDAPLGLQNGILKAALIERLHRRILADLF
jgi:hypothetical protein